MANQWNTERKGAYNERIRRNLANGIGVYRFDAPIVSYKRERRNI